MLLLGCGDVRNILFTVYGDGGCGESLFLIVLYLLLTQTESRTLDITCCDVETAVLGQ